MERRMVIATGGIVIASAGCLGWLEDSDPPPVGALEFDIRDVRSPDLGLNSITLPIVLDVTNTADREVPNPSLDVTMYVENNPVASVPGALPTIPGNETITQTIDVVIEYGEVGEAIVDAIQSGEFRVRMDGTVESEGVTANLVAES